ncbi:MAG: hypothetical protein K8J31_29940 [Anaerolineae bacterium]|nr:hypothetical protein [Anaerolineae bacterium]
MPYSPLDLAAAFIQTGELADALDVLNQHLVHQPQDDRARRLRIDVLRHLGRRAHLETALDDSNQLAEPTAEDAICQSLLLEQMEDDHGAAACLSRALQMWPDHARLIERDLNLLLRLDRADEALNVVRAQPKVWRWLQWEGDALVASGNDLMATARYGLALADLEAHRTPENAAYLRPIQARLLLARAAAYLRLEMLDPAEDQYQAAESLLPDDPAIPFNRGLLAWLRGDADEARSLCRAALESASENQRERLLDDLRGDPRCAALWAALSNP